MEMSAVIQVFLLLGILAFIVFVASIVPLIFVARRRLSQADAFFIECRELIQNINNLSKRADQQMDSSLVVLQTAQKWTESADRVMDQVGTTMDRPIFWLIRNGYVLRKGAKAFLQVLFQNDQNSNLRKVENSHV